MALFGNVTREVTGPLRFKDQCQFDQSITGMLGVPGTGKIYYVDKNKTSGVTGDGSSWLAAFLTVTEGFAALSDYDVLIIAPGNYDETAKLTLTGLKGVKIFGYGTGMQWNEGSTCIRDVSHTVAADLLDITGCQALEIAGISFISTDSYDAINFTGLNYSTHIHDCCFVGDTGGGATQLYGINLGTSNGPDTYINHCKFFHCLTTGIHVGGSNQRFVCHDCVFIIPNNGIGIDITPMASSYHVIHDCKFLGTAGDGADMGIDIGDVSLQGRIGVYNCRFASCTMTGGGTTGEEASVENYESTAAGGAIIDPT